MSSSQNEESVSRSPSPLKQQSEHSVEESDGDLSDSESEQLYPSDPHIRNTNSRSRRRIMHHNQRRRRGNFFPRRPSHLARPYHRQFNRRRPTRFSPNAPFPLQRNTYEDTVIPRLLFNESKQAYRHGILTNEADFIHRCRRLGDVAYRNRGHPSLYRVLWNELKDEVDVHCLLCISNYNFCKDFLHGTFADITRPS